jgi:hypothetical protein
VQKIPKWLPSLHEPGSPRLWRIGYALAACFLVALAGLAALWAMALVLLHHPALPRSNVISVHDSVGVAQLVFASVAGAGALVALVVAYRRQRVSEASSAHDRTRVFNERFTAIAAQLGEDKPAVRLAGVHAMAGLADDWAENRQTCIDVLCAYLRLPYDPAPGEDTAPAERAAYRANREVRIHGPYPTGCAADRGGRPSVRGLREAGHARHQVGGERLLGTSGAKSPRTSGGMGLCSKLLIATHRWFPLRRSRYWALVWLATFASSRRMSRSRACQAFLRERFLSKRSSLLRNELAAASPAEMRARIAAGTLPAVVASPAAPARAASTVDDKPSDT